MKCMRCGYQSPAPFSRCPSCGNVQAVSQQFAPAAPVKTKTGKRTGGETAAITIAVIASCLSVCAAFVIFIGFLSAVGSRIASDTSWLEEFEDSDPDDSISNYEKFFNDFYNNGDTGSLNSPAGLNAPLKFKDKLYSFSEGEVETEYEVSMTGTYRGEAALKLLEGAALPNYDKNLYDVYLVQFSVRITEQDKDAIVTFPSNNPVALKSDAKTIFSNQYQTVSGLDYANKYSLISTGKTVQTWVAFIVDKDEQSPCIMWNRLENKVFRSDKYAVTDPASVNAGEAIEIKENNDSVSSSEDASSDGDVSSN